MTDPGSMRASAAVSISHATPAPLIQPWSSLPNARNGHDEAGIIAIIEAHGGPFYSFGAIPGLQPTGGFASNTATKTVYRVNALLSSSDRRIERALHAWLLNCKSATTRQNYLRGLADFLSWLNDATRAMIETCGSAGKGVPSRIIR